MLDVRRLRVLSEVAACGSFSAAAEALTLTQSGVSQHVAALEREVGLPLVERGTRPVQLTEAGFALSRHATAIFARLDGAEQELGEIAGRRHGRLRFGCFPTALATLMPPAFAQFRRSHPEVRLTVVDDHLHRLVPRLDGAARDLDRTPLLDDVYQAVVPASHPLARSSRPLELAELSDESWIGGAPSSAWYRIISHACRLAGFVPQADYASDDYIAVQALVAAGLGVSVIPGLAVKHPLPGVAVRPLAAAAPIRQISAARPRDAYEGPAVASMLNSLSAAAQAFQ